MHATLHNSNPTILSILSHINIAYIYFGINYFENKCSFQIEAACKLRDKNRLFGWELSEQLNVEDPLQPKSSAVEGEEVPVSMTDTEQVPNENSFVGVSQSPIDSQDGQDGMSANDSVNIRRSLRPRRKLNMRQHYDEYDDEEPVYFEEEKGQEDIEIEETMDSWAGAVLVAVDSTTVVRSDEGTMYFISGSLFV